MHHLLSAPMMLDLAASDQFFQKITDMERVGLNAERPTSQSELQAFFEAVGMRAPEAPSAMFDFEDDLGGENDLPFPVIDGEAFLTLSGVLGKQLPWYARYYGMTDINDFQANLKLVKERDDIDRYRVTGHTPGGSVIGIIETMRQARLVGKPSVFQSDTYFNSAGYFIASAFDRIEATASCRLGSIGVIMGLYDYSGLAAEQKVKPIVIRSGPNKAPGYLFGEKITKEQIALFTADVAGLFDRHDALLSEYRPQISAEMKDGRVISGEEAYYVGLIDDEVPEIRRVASL